MNGDRKEEALSIADVYRQREYPEQDGRMIYLYNLMGQRLRVQLIPSQEIEIGSRYPVLLERPDGQLLRKYLHGSDLVYVTGLEC